MKWNLLFALLLAVAVGFAQAAADIARMARWKKCRTRWPELQLPGLEARGDRAGAEALSSV